MAGSSIPSIYNNSYYAFLYHKNRVAIGQIVPENYSMQHCGVHISKINCS
jgi:hypothetical protein